MTEKERLGLSTESTLSTLMAETQINETASSEPDPHPGAESYTCDVTETWQ